MNTITVTGLYLAWLALLAFAGICWATAAARRAIDWWRGRRRP